MNKRIVSMIRKLSKTEQEISLTELAEGIPDLPADRERPARFSPESGQL